MNLLGLIILLIFFAGSVPAYAEFYKYVDESGVVLFTDDLSQVPVDQRPGLHIYTESYRATGDTTDKQQKPMDINEVQKLLERQKQELDRAYQELLMEEARLEQEKKNLKTDEDIEKHNEKIRGFNERSRKHLEKKDAYELQNAAYSKRLKVETAGPPDSAIKKPISTQNTETPSIAYEQNQEAEEDINAMRARLERIRQELDQEYQALAKEKQQVAAEQKNIKTYSNALASKDKITKLNELNEKIIKYEEKQKAFNAAVDIFTARLKQALNEKPEKTVSGTIKKQ
ncbi:MAG: DUF4124 domain-containing protein [Desulfobacterales bacterium]|uniref:DUF4124 domain-containing protein n=1 Tax=Candidatus Desulfatibia vada TaxID=2841696 RepID=A0A8J6TRW2_9BACT|nr:DUF4124 domain-containing protein [Candidatus Desulfatibia vada]